MENRGSIEREGNIRDKFSPLKNNGAILLSKLNTTIKNIILFHANQVISHLCFFNDKVEYPILFTGWSI